MLDTAAECLIGLGGNIGPVARTIDGALAVLPRYGVDVLAVSRLYRSEAMGTHAGGSFLNAAARVRTSLEPHALLGVLQTVEETFGRTRESHWGPRTLDLDLLACADRVMETERLILPHPGMWYRRFVLQPLQEIAGPWRHPVCRQTVDDLLQRMDRRPMLVELPEHAGPQNVPDRYASAVCICRSGEVPEPAAGEDDPVFCRLQTADVSPAHLPAVRTPFRIECRDEAALQEMLQGVLAAALSTCRPCVAD